MWYLCQVLRGKTPHRDPASKVTEDEEIVCSCKVTYNNYWQWYVSEEEWPGAVYPDYCAGWVYVTTTATLAAVLARAQEGEE